MEKIQNGKDVKYHFYNNTLLQVLKIALLNSIHIIFI